MDLAALFAQVQRIAVLGAHHDAWRPAFYVPEYLHQAGFSVIGVNPALKGELLWGRPVVGRLAEAGPVEMVDVFRRAELLPAHLPEFLEMNPRPLTIWLQSGIRNDAFAKIMEEQGIQVVQDRCAMVEHRRFTQLASRSR